jgi:FlaA1/EpsC-like NDP-sugar epimerase
VAARFSLGPLGLLLALPLMGLPRIWRRERWRQEIRNHCPPRQRNRIAVYGAGSRGAALVTLLEQGFANVEVVGFLDDSDEEMRGREIAGRRVLGSERDLDSIHAMYDVDAIWLTFEPDMYKHNRVRKWCIENGVDLVVLPLVEPFASLHSVEQTQAVCSD